MRAFYVVFGLLSMVLGVLCLFNPFESFMAIGIIVAVFLLLVGIYYIMMFFMSRRDRSLLMTKPVVGVAGLLIGIAMVVIAILSVAVPSVGEILDMVILIMFAVWMIFNGVMEIFSGVNVRKMEQPGGIAMIVIGAIIAAAGVYGLIHMVIFSETLGLMLGILLIVYGVDLVISAFTDPSADACDMTS